MPKAVEYMGIKIKLCSRCNEFKKVEDFNGDKSKSDGLTCWCKECCYENTKRWRANNPEQCVEKLKQWRMNNPKKSWVIQSLYKHRQKGFKVKITNDALFDLAKNTETCPLCGCELDWSLGTKSKPQHDSPTLDRVDNTDTITLDNIQIICHRCNLAKSTMLMKEFIEYCKNVADRNNYLLEVKD